MKRSEIYYFTGTGNSLAVAGGIAERIGAETVPMAGALKRADGGLVRPAAGIIGMVFPVYYIDLPNMVKNFARRLRVNEDGYVFAVATYGGGRGSSLETLADLTETNGIALSATFGIHMPQNAFYKFWERKKKIFRRAERAMDGIADVVRSEGRYPAGGPRRSGGLTKKLHEKFIGMSGKYLATLSPSTEDDPIEDLIYRADASFRTNENCNGCGNCVTVCPADNIRLKDGKPEWLRRCENCRACLNFCPRKAIYGEAFGKGYLYRCPGISFVDIAGQKK